MENTFKFQSTCRICSSQQENYVYILGDEGYRLNLQLKIRKYLYITVSTNDQLPKMICKGCCKKLNAMHKFASMALQVQNKFTKMLEVSEMETDWLAEHKSLLHSYLLKGKQECEKQLDEDITEVEVRVDPSLFLQCIDDDSGDDDIDCSSDNTTPTSPEPYDFSRKADLADNATLLENNSYVDGRDEASKLVKTDIKEEIESVSLNNTHINASSVPDGIKSHLCAICQVALPSEGELKVHLWSHLSSGGRKVLMAADSNSLANHETDSNHSNVDDDTSSSENLNMQPFSCPVCGKQISTKGNLKVHLETHRPKGKYACDICGRIFKTQSNLFRHKEYHGGIQFPCNVCGRVYPTNSTLRAHSITHSDLRPHKCPLCDKTFKRNQDLKFHINQHTGARPYRCLYCPKAFASSGNCFSHRKRMHPQEVERDRERADQIMR